MIARRSEAEMAAKANEANQQLGSLELTVANALTADERTFFVRLLDEA